MGHREHRGRISCSMGNHIPDRGSRPDPGHGLRHPAHPGPPSAGDPAQARRDPPGHTRYRQCPAHPRARVRRRIARRRQSASIDPPGCARGPSSVRFRRWSHSRLVTGVVRWRAGGAAGRICCPPRRRAHASPRLRAARRRPGGLRRPATGPVRRPWLVPTGLRPTCRRNGPAARTAASATALSTLAGAAVGTVNAKPRNGLIAFMRPGMVGEYDIRVVQPYSTGLRRQRGRRRFPARSPPAAASAGRMARPPPGRQAGTGSPSAAPRVRVPRRGPHGSRSASRTPTAAWLIRSTPPEPRPSRAFAPMATPGPRLAPGSASPARAPSNAGDNVTSPGVPHTTATGGKSRSPPHPAQPGFVGLAAP
jgi:hypothetical protein